MTSQPRNHQGKPPHLWGRPRFVLWLPLVALLVGTIFFVATGSDLTIAAAYHDPEGGWVEKDAPVFAWLYDYGTMPAAILTGVALVVLLGGLVWERARPWRKIAAYFVLVVVIAPGILVNAVFKEHWGRPRPREVTDFGGRERFEKVWEYDSASAGKSFPSGHASMGFCLFGLFFIGRALRRRWALWAIATGVLLGTALGLARIAQGGHFASDVLWSAGFCYFTSLGLARLMRLGERPLVKAGPTSRFAWVALGVGVLGAGALAGAVPYQEEKRIEGKAVIAGEPVRVDVKLGRAELGVVPGERFLFTSHVEAFGMIGSALMDRLTEDEPNVFKLRQNRDGSFAAIEQPASLTVPGGAKGSARIEVRKGSVKVALFPGEWNWDIIAHDGDVVLQVPDGLELKVSRDSATDKVSNSVPGLEWSDEKARWKRGDNPQVKVRVRGGGGELILVPTDR